MDKKKSNTTIYIFGFSFILISYAVYKYLTSDPDYITDNIYIGSYYNASDK